MVPESETIVAVKVADPAAGMIDYRLNILRIRVWEHFCQVIARSGKAWGTIGPRCDLPAHVPQNAEELKAAAAKPLGADRVSILRRTSGVRSRSSAERDLGFRSDATDGRRPDCFSGDGPLAPQ
jgi:hypothetical protein